MFKRLRSEESECEGDGGNVSLWSNGSFRYSTFVRRLTAEEVVLERRRRRREMNVVNKFVAIEED